MALQAEEIAESVLFAARQPPRVTVAQLLILPSNRY
jgi:NADP-dependent 3-hydroxy acid dehydrogenase YdfG